jgi:hypothetical protein
MRHLLKVSGFCLGILVYGLANAQELYIFTDPASNIPAKALSLRVNSMVMPMRNLHPDQLEQETSLRISTDLAYGISKNLMVKAALYGSDMFQPGWQYEAASFSAKYRFLSRDNFHSHTRMAAFGKLAFSCNPYTMPVGLRHFYPDGNGGTYPHDETIQHGADEQQLEGNHSGWQVGIVATRLEHKLAISATLSALSRFDNGRFSVPENYASSAMQYSISAGYLLFPREYASYGQTNLNLYAEFIGQSTFDRQGNFMDAAPGVQWIFSSKARLDLAYRFQLWGDMRRFNRQMALLRFEYNWLQAFAKKEKPEG